ncbi:DUF1183-domain-containing protein [Hygrophoropsis aurantiaca]|uniref:DUF1183-domain-containing protein n=1 Tax=Hygrophoropsis aurantiaca TaxID=72124 RepID=A0ACB8AQV5_9AGAM|nr:DUF1183-domain-containing protein [Hygrophoropsis aurantiaca]
MTRIALESIPALTFYKNTQTTARRTSPIEQLICVGKPCSLYQPEVVRCKNIGGSGTEVDWKCEADLPSSLRFGKVEVSCEGWNGPGDPFVMKGSCSLEYHLVQLPGTLRDDYSSFGRPSLPNWLKTLDASGMIFMIAWIAILALIAYNLIFSCLRRNYPPSGNFQRITPPRYPGAGGGSGNFHPGSPPPPYTKNPPEGSMWNPGFWTGAALGGLGAHLLNRSRSQPTRLYDWEEERSPFTARRRPTSNYDDRDRNWDRGEGSSNLGATRSSTGYGGSRSR